VSKAVLDIAVWGNGIASDYDCYSCSIVRKQHETLFPSASIDKIINRNMSSPLDLCVAQPPAI
jgi:hypothetical protein